MESADCVRLTASKSVAMAWQDRNSYKPALPRIDNAIGQLAQLLLDPDSAFAVCSSCADWYAQADDLLIAELQQLDDVSLRTYTIQCLRQVTRNTASPHQLQSFVLCYLRVIRSLALSLTVLFRNYLAVFESFVEIMDIVEDIRFESLIILYVRHLKVLSVQAEQQSPELRMRSFHDKSFVQEAVFALVKLFHAAHNHRIFAYRSLWVLNTMISYMRAARVICPFASLSDCNLVPTELADTHLSTLEAVDNRFYDLSTFPIKDRVQFLYYQACDCFEEDEYSKALPYIKHAFNLCPFGATKMKRKLLCMVIACRMLKGYLPSAALLIRYQIFEPWHRIIQCVRSGYFRDISLCIEQYSEFFEMNNVADFLSDIPKRMVLRSLFRKVVRLWLAIAPPIGKKPPSLSCEVFVPALDLSFGPLLWDNMSGSKQDYVLVALTSLISSGYAKGYVSFKSYRYVMPRADAMSGIFPPPAEVQFPRREFEAAPNDLNDSTVDRN